MGGRLSLLQCPDDSLAPSQAGFLLGKGQGPRDYLPKGAGSGLLTRPRGRALVRLLGPDRASTGPGERLCHLLSHRPYSCLSHTLIGRWNSEESSAP